MIIEGDEQGKTQAFYHRGLHSKGKIDNLYRFSTKEYDSTSGSIYFGARYYDLRIGRFIRKDPWTWQTPLTSRKKDMH